MCKLIKKLIYLFLKDNSASNKVDVDPVMVYHVLQTTAFCMMAMIIMRLKLFFTPQLCILAALLLNAKVVYGKYFIYLIWREKIVNRSKTLLINYILFHLFQYVPFLRSRALHLSLIAILVAGMSIEGVSNLKKQHDTIGNYF